MTKLPFIAKYGVEVFPTNKQFIFMIGTRIIDLEKGIEYKSLIAQYPNDTQKARIECVNYFILKEYAPKVIRYSKSKFPDRILKIYNANLCRVVNMIAIRFHANDFRKVRGILRQMYKDKYHVDPQWPLNLESVMRGIALLNALWPEGTANALAGAVKQMGLEDEDNDTKPISQ